MGMPGTSRMIVAGMIVGGMPVSGGSGTIIGALMAPMRGVRGSGATVGRTIVGGGAVRTMIVAGAGIVAMRCRHAVASDAKHFARMSRRCLKKRISL